MSGRPGPVVIALPENMLTEKVDEKLIGGAVIRMGDKQLDASVLRQINNLKQTFNKNLYIKDF